MSAKTLATQRPFLGLTSTFNDFFEPWSEWFQDGFAGRQLTLPKVNITENTTHYNLELAAPGLHKKDFKIDVNGNILTVSGHKEENKEEEKDQVTRQEYNYSSFSRSFTLPDEVEQDKIDANYDSGILKLVLPKNEKAAKKTKKTISIK
jgi:HSP20 family protein